jgi:hypothetical protein
MNRYKEMPEQALLKVSIKCALSVSMQFHIKDMLGSGKLLKLVTPSGSVIYRTANATTAR